MGRTVTRAGLALGAMAMALAAGGCMREDGAMADAGGRYAAGSFKAEAVLMTPGGATVGSATAQETPQGLRVTVNVSGLPAGVHGAHVHTTGKCDAPDFASAGGHWNPTAKHHGLESPMGSHAGDMPNLVVSAEGKGAMAFVLLSGTYEGLLDEDGAAIVVHAGPDDMKSDPSGNSGGRIACGVFGAV